MKQKSPQASLFLLFVKAGRRGANLLDKNVVFNGEHTEGKAPSPNNPFMFKILIFQASLPQTPPPFLEGNKKGKKPLLLFQALESQLNAQYLEN